MEVERRKHKVFIRRVYELSSPMNTLHIDDIPISHCLSFFMHIDAWQRLLKEQKTIILKICKCFSLPQKNHLFMQNQHKINALNHFGQDLRNIN